MSCNTYTILILVYTIICHINGIHTYNYVLTSQIFVEYMRCYLLKVQIHVHNRVGVFKIKFSNYCLMVTYDYYAILQLLIDTVYDSKNRQF